VKVKSVRNTTPAGVKAVATTRPKAAGKKTSGKKLATPTGRVWRGKAVGRRMERKGKKTDQARVPRRLAAGVQMSATDGDVQRKRIFRVPKPGTEARRNVSSQPERNWDWGEAHSTQLKFGGRRG